MPSANGFGISAMTGTLIESVEVSYESEEKMLMDRLGEFSEARLIDVTTTFTVRGSGDTSVAIGGTSGAPNGADGKVVITSVKRTQVNDDFEKFEYSGTAYPSAN
jgi:hypothetical protein